MDERPRRAPGPDGLRVVVLNPRPLVPAIGGREGEPSPAPVCLLLHLVPFVGDSLACRAFSEPESELVRIVGIIADTIARDRPQPRTPPLVEGGVAGKCAQKGEGRCVPHLIGRAVRSPPELPAQ